MTGTNYDPSIVEAMAEALTEAAAQAEADAAKLHNSVHGRSLADKAKRWRVHLAAFHGSGPATGGPVAARVATEGSNKIGILLYDLPVGTPLYERTTPPAGDGVDRGRLNAENERLRGAMMFGWRIARSGVYEKDALTLACRTYPFFGDGGDLPATPAGEPHCTGHERFEYDCIDCSDALERQRKADTPAGPKGGESNQEWNDRLVEALEKAADEQGWIRLADGREFGVIEIYKRFAQPATPAGGGGELPAYGIIDPDYARVFTIARCLAWSEGYMLAMHGSFTRDLDLIAVPWTETACEPEHLMRRIEDAAGLTNTTDEPSQKPHGRLVWTLMFPGFSDPRFVDLGIVSPRRLASTQAAGGGDSPTLLNWLAGRVQKWLDDLDGDTQTPGGSECEAVDILADHGEQIIAAIRTSKVALIDDARSPSYDALLIIAQSVAGALHRAGLTDCDDPGEAIDVLRERYERRIAELTATPAGGGDDMPRLPEPALQEQAEFIGSEYRAYFTEWQMFAFRDAGIEYGRRLASAPARVGEVPEAKLAAAYQETVRRYQDGRVFHNVHTRQVARAIQQEAEALAAAPTPEAKP